MSNKKGTSHIEQLNRIKRIEGQVRGISKMVEEERYCIDILNQIKAVMSALKSVQANIIDAHLSDCVIDAVASQNEKEAMEVLDEIKGLLKSTAK